MVVEAGQVGDWHDFQAAFLQKPDMVFQKEYRKFVEGKFGSHVVDKILSSPRLELTSTGDKESQEKVASHIVLLEKNMNFSAPNGWGFDFPGWVGNLEKSNGDYRREIMVIGMEPHIEGRDFQVTYGLVETDENEFMELDWGNNTALWQRLYGMFASEEESYKSRAFLERFYITDLCHFAPKGKAKLVKDNNWKKIRTSIASKFLSDEIALISPEIIVSQSGPVAGFVDNCILKNIGKDTRWRPNYESKGRDGKLNLPSSKIKYLPFLTEYQLNVNGKKLIHVGLPHIASGFTNHFWNIEGMLDALKSEIAKFKSGH